MKLSKIIEDVEIRPKSIIVLGAPRSGKTSWTLEYLEKNRLHEYEDLNIINFLDSEERTTKLDECLDSKKNFIFEGITVKKDRIESLIKKIKDSDYRVSIVHMDKELDTILENDNGTTPKRAVKKIYYKLQDLIENAEFSVDKIIEVD